MLINGIYFQIEHQSVNDNNDNNINLHNVNKWYILPDQAPVSKR